MARLTFNSCRDMPTVIEGDVIEKIVHFHPFDGCVLRERISNLSNLGRVFQDLCMTVHASACGWNPRYLRFIGPGVAIKTLNLVITGVDLVREIDWLHRLVSLLIAKPAKD